MAQDEQKLQSKILKWLNNNGGWAVKVESVTRGMPDILCCWKGKFIAIEVKSPEGKCTAIQRAQHVEIRNKGGIVIVARCLNDVKEMLK